MDNLGASFNKATIVFTCNKVCISTYQKLLVFFTKIYWMKGLQDFLIWNLLDERIVGFFELEKRL